MENLRGRGQECGDAGISEGSTHNHGTDEDKHGEVEGDADSKIHLKRQFGLVSATALIVGTMIGSGIFISPKGIIQNTNSVGMSIVIWIVCGMISICGALCYAELGLMIPLSGGEYSYLLKMYGQMTAFAYSWTASFILRPSSAVIVLTCAQYMVLPLYEGTECTAPNIAVKLVAVCILMLLMTINCLSVRLATFVTNFFTLAKLIALAIIIVVGVVELFKGGTEYLNPKTSFAGSSTSVSSYALALYSGLWAYEGWANLNLVTEEITNYKRNLPLAIIIALLTVTCVYVLTNIAYFTVLSPEELIQSDIVAYSFARKTIGSFAIIIQLSVVFSTFGSSNASLLASGRIPYAAAREGHMPQILSMIHVKRITPVPAVLFIGLMTIILVIPGDVSTLINYFSFAQWMVYGIAIFGVILFRYQHPEWERPIKVPIFLPIVMVFVSAYLVIAPIIEDPTLEFLYAFLFIVTGFLAYFPFVKFNPHPKILNKTTEFLQQLFLVAPSGYNT